MKLVNEQKKKYPSSSPLELEVYVSEELQKSNIQHAGLMQMLIQLHAWKLLLQEFENIDEFLEVFKPAYKILSGFIHSTLDTTYTYIEKTTENETRVFWGAQFSKRFLEKEIEEIIRCVDFLLTLVLSSISSESIEKDGLEHLTSIQHKFTALKETLVLSYPTTESIISRNPK